MRIAHVVCVFPPYKGGMGNSVYNFVKYLDKKGCETKVFTPDHGMGPAGFEANEGARVERMKPFLKIGNAAFLPQLLWNLKGFDIVHLHYPFFGAAEFVLLSKFFSRKKFKLITHFHMENRAKGIKGLVFFVYRVMLLPLLARASEIIISSSFDYVKHSSLKNYFLKNRNKFREVRFGIDVGKFSPKENGGKNGKKTILFVGRLDKAYHPKGLDVLLKAMKIITTKNRNEIILRVIGEGDLKNDYIELARKLGVGDKVEFLDKIDNKKLVDYYNDCDVFTLPSSSKGEAFGIVLLEAMACAKPVVASDIPGVRSVFINGEHGLLAKSGDAEDLAEKINMIIINENKAKAMGSAARRYAEENYSLEASGAKLEEVYKQLAAN